MAATGVGAVLAALLLSAAAGADESDPVESGREALERVGRLPWYDEEEDELRRVNVSPPDEPPSRSDAASAELDDSSNNWSFNNGSLLLSILQWTGWSLIGLLILVLLVLGIRALADRGRGDELELPEMSRRITSDVDRMEQLPVPLKRDLSDLLGEARRQYEQGNYNEAIIYLYSYLLVELDRGQQIRLLKGKTNRQYLREMREAPPSLRELVEQTMVAFEDVFFGDRDLERARFESCYQRLDEFHHYLEPVAA